MKLTVIVAPSATNDIFYYNAGGYTRIFGTLEATQAK